MKGLLSSSHQFIIQKLFYRNAQQETYSQYHGEQHHKER